MEIRDYVSIGMAEMTVMGLIACALLWIMLTEDKVKEEEREVEEKKREDHVVRFYLAPEAEESNEPSVSNHIPVHLRGHNLLPAYVNGRYCEIFVDCGTSSALMKYTRAKHLGLLSQARECRRMQVRMWARRTMARMKIVKDVKVELGAGVSFPCTFLVAPRDGPINCLRNDIFLDNATLRRNRVIQRFTPSSSVLFFPDPLPAYYPRTSPDTQFELQNARRGKSLQLSRLKVHVDTGARFFYASSKHYHEHKSLELVIAKDSSIKWNPIVRTPSTTFDFVIGTLPLGKYLSIIDYANHDLYLCVDNKFYKVKLIRTCTL